MSFEDIKNKVAVVTGGTGALGGAAANHLASCGAHVVILSRNLTSAENKAESITRIGGSAIGFAADILDSDDLTKIKQTILDKWGSIDILINAAGGNMPGATIRPDQTIFDLNIADFNLVNELNLNGSLIPSLIFGDEMCKKGKGSIINYSSMAADRVITRVAGYSAAKAAIENFTKWLAVEFAHKFGEGIRVNAVAPGFFIGEQNRSLLTKKDGSYTERGNTIIKNTPMGRFGKAEELNGVIELLASDMSSFITGTVIAIDGGFSAFSGV